MHVKHTAYRETSFLPRFVGACITTFLTSEIKQFLENAAAFPACSSDTRGQVSLPANTQRQETAPQRGHRPILGMLMCYYTSSNHYSEYQISFRHMMLTCRQERRSLSHQRTKIRRFAWHTPFEGTTAFSYSQNSILITKPTTDTSSSDFTIKYAPQLRPSFRRAACNFRFPMQYPQG